ncbi:MAG: BrnT family toxin [Elusimicrobia bacterium]|nr:BrnT family toxin [Elusimicrobiota bacterium]
MTIPDFEWDDSNIEHLGGHNVVPAEVEEVFESRHYIAGGRDGRYLVLGKTAAGRYLLCVIERSSRSAAFRVVTARDMENWERKLYKRKG